MNTITINNKTVEFQQGETVLDVAKRIGFEIPTMCHTPKLSPQPSCMVCVVHDKNRNTLIPSCASVALPNMEIDTVSELVKEAQKTAIDLLLSDHVGDCYAPCQRICPAGMDIPEMNRLVAQRKFKEANRVVKQHIPIPVTLGYACSAPCEKGCRRKTVDETINICRIKRFAGEQDLFSDQPWLPKIEKERDEQVIVVGGGPTGITAAWYLRTFGYQVTLIDSNSELGGSLLHEKEEILPKGIIQKEADLLAHLGVKLELGKRVSEDEMITYSEKRDAVIVCTGTNSNFQTLKHSNLFFAGSTVRKLKMAVQAVGKGREVTMKVHQKLCSDFEVAEPLFNSSFGKLLSSEFNEYQKESVIDEKVKVENWTDSFSMEQAQNEAARCFHCDCRAKENCALQDLATELKANQKLFLGERKLIQKDFTHPDIVFEQEKCIKCGICIRLAEKHSEEVGLSFSGRGFNVHVEAALFESIKEAITISPNEIVEACPTGAICRK